MKTINWMSYLAIGIVCYFLGTMSTLYAEDKKSSDTDTMKKLEMVIKNQTEMMKTLKFIKNKV